MTAFLLPRSVFIPFAVVAAFAVVAPAQTVEPALESTDAEQPVVRSSVVLVPKLRGLMFVATPEQAAEPVPVGFSGIDASRAPLLHGVKLDVAFGGFLDVPATVPSIERLTNLVRAGLRHRGEAFVVAYVPPQDVTEDVLRVVVTRAKLDGDVTLEGAKYFSAEQYRGALPAFAAGAEVDSAAIAFGLERLNQNPFRRVTSVTEAGREAGTTRLMLRIEEQFPLRVGASYDNTGTPTTGEDRVGASVTWGNALGRGDLMTYRYLADSTFDHLQSHSGNYTTVLPWRHVLTFHGAWSEIESAMPAPLTQQGNSWQIGAHYAVPLRALRNGWTQTLGFTADFKYSDNTLEFAAIPITDNVTHVAQLGATYGVSFAKFGGQNSVALSGYASPGGLTRYNKTSAFDGSRPGAKADYVYGRLHLAHQRPLGLGFSWSTNAEIQFASGALLGSEQMSGSGSYAVRGYRENTSFGDAGVIVTNELHAPAFSLFKRRDLLDVFAFVDIASLHLHVDEESTELRSAGLGLNYSFDRHLSVRASYGWQMKRLDGSTDNGRGHISANLAF